MIFLLAGCGAEEPAITLPGVDTAAQWEQSEERQSEPQQATAAASSKTTEAFTLSAAAGDPTSTAARPAANTTTRATTTTTTRAQTTKPTQASITSAAATAAAVPTSSIPEKTQRRDYNVRIIGPLTVRVGEQIQLRAEVTDASGSAVDIPLIWSVDTIKRTQLLFDGQERNIYEGEAATFVGKQPGDSYCGVRCYDPAAREYVSYESFTIVVTE
ncbi:MAG: hypothetical protein LBB75_10130 [Oscillospiraceae bacterium]|jgi:hypothetical protein|nr:hypothetical protein [Oscillospiraceae bacterium]